MSDLHVLAEELVRMYQIRLAAVRAEILHSAEYDVPAIRRYDNKLCAKHQFRGYNKKLTLWRHRHRSCR